jgi:hypothetical protein
MASEKEARLTDPPEFRLSSSTHVPAANALDELILGGDQLPRRVTS